MQYAFAYIDGWFYPVFRVWNSILCGIGIHWYPYPDATSCLWCDIEDYCDDIEEL